MNISCCVDWLTVTGKQPGHDDDDGGMNHARAEKLGRDIMTRLGYRNPALLVAKPQPFYPFVFQDTTSQALFKMSDRPSSQGWAAVLNGQSLKHITTGSHTVSVMDHLDARSTRIDVAFDVFDSGCLVADLHAAYAKGRAGRKNRSYAFYASPNGDTLYLGSRTSDLMVRVYEKGKQMRMSVDWLRFEIEIKGKFCRQHYPTLLSQPETALPHLVKMLEMSDNPVVQHLIATYRDQQPLERVSRAGGSKREEWLRTQVLSSLVKLAKEDKEAARRVMSELEQTVRKYLVD